MESYQFAKYNYQSQGVGVAALFCEKHVVSVESNQTLDRVARMMKEHRIGDIIVVEKRNDVSVPIGMITDRDLAIEVVARAENADSMYASDIMSPQVTTAKLSDDVFTMIAIMKKSKIGRLPVIDEDGGLCGIVTAKAILRFLVNEIENLIHISDRNVEGALHPH